MYLTCDCCSNVEELQELNARLTSTLREAELKRDEMVQAAQKHQMADMQQKLDAALHEVRVMTEHNEKQQKILEVMDEEREKWKAMYDELKTAPSRARTTVCASP